MDLKIFQIFQEAQHSVGCQMKLSIDLKKIYDRMEMMGFFNVFKCCINIIFHSAVKINAGYSNKAMQFAAEFTVKLLTDVEIPGTSGKTKYYPFVNKILNEVLQYHNLEKNVLRLQACRFITMVLDGLSENGYLDKPLCDLIEACMLERLSDYNVDIRIQAIMALARLQNPYNEECPIIEGLLKRFTDPNPSVRSEIAKRIAKTPKTFVRLVTHVRDVDPTVRKAVFLRCSRVRPSKMTIEMRQQVLCAGFRESKKQPKECFEKDLLPIWLECYNKNIIDFLTAINLDADQMDIDWTKKLCEKILDTYFRLFPLDKIVDSLPVNELKVIPQQKLTYVAVCYWRQLLNHLEEKGADELLSRARPELLNFCSYIDGFIDLHSNTELESWKTCILTNIMIELFEITVSFDLADEMGRKRLKELVTNMLAKPRLEPTLTSKLVEILEKLHTSHIKVLINDILSLINDFRDQNHVPQGNFENETDALDLGESTNNTELTKYEVKKHCADILIGLLQLGSVRRVNNVLLDECQDVIKNLWSAQDLSLSWRALKLQALCGLHDAPTASEHIQEVCMPIFIYRTTKQHDLVSLITSIEAVTDLILLYGTSLFPLDEINRNTCHEGHPLSNFSEIRESNTITYEGILGTLIDMFSENNSELRYKVAVALYKIIPNGLIRCHAIIVRILMKWFTPCTEKTDLLIQQILGDLLVQYSQPLQATSDVMEKAILTTLTNLATMPKTSPLIGVDHYDVCKFMAALIHGGNTAEINPHSNLILILLDKISNKPHSVCVNIWITMLLHLDLPNDDLAQLKKYKCLTDIILLDLVEKKMRRRLVKFIKNIDTYIENLESRFSVNSELDESPIKRMRLTPEPSNIETFNNHSESPTESTAAANNLKRKNDISLADAALTSPNKIKRERLDPIEDIQQLFDNIFRTGDNCN